MVEKKCNFKQETENTFSVLLFLANKKQKVKPNIFLKLLSIENKNSFQRMKTRNENRK